MTAERRNEQTGASSRLKSYLRHRAMRQAEMCQAQGKPHRAAAWYARAGAFHQAARAAIAAGDERRAVACSLRAALGVIPATLRDAGALQAAELLADGSHHGEAVGLFELAGAHRQAAESAMQLHHFARAARDYERAGMWPDAAACYERCGRLDAALRMLENESKRLRGSANGLPRAAIAETLSRVEVQRAMLLRRLGRIAEGADLLRDVKLTPAAVDLLGEAGRYAEAIEACLEIGDGERAAQLLRRASDLDRRLVARVYLRFGRPLEAGNILAAAGLAREAAEAYEAGCDWPKAGSRWEAAREHERAAQAYEKAGRPRDAARCFDAAGKPLLAAACRSLAGDHAFAAALYLKGGQPMTAATCLAAAGDRAGAAKILMLIEPGDADFVAGTLALIPLLLDEGLVDDACRRLRRLPAPEARAARERLSLEARQSEDRGQKARAEQIYRALLELAPGDASARERLRELENRRQASAEPAVMPAGDAGAAADLATAVRPRTEAPAELLAGRYELLGELGRGGMGRVYKAHDRVLDELVAIKMLLSPSAADAVDAERLLREVQICRMVTHPNVVRVFDLGRCEGGIFITMELLAGDRLDDLIAREGALPLPRVRRILQEIGAGLGEAHALGIVHRDLKPGNIILTASRLKILDFGIARLVGVESHLTQAGFALGSVLYISPEQLQGEPADGRADLYSLGVLTYTMIAGQEPFTGATAGEVALKHLQQPPPDLRRARPGLPAGWSELVETLLAKRPADRFKTIGEMLAALAALPDEPV